MPTHDPLQRSRTHVAAIATALAVHAPALAQARLVSEERQLSAWFEVINRPDSVRNYTTSEWSDANTAGISLDAYARDLEVQGLSVTSGESLGSLIAGLHRNLEGTDSRFTAVYSGASSSAYLAPISPLLGIRTTSHIEMEWVFELDAPTEYWMSAWADFYGYSNTLVTSVSVVHTELFASLTSLEPGGGALQDFHVTLIGAGFIESNAYGVGAMTAGRYRLSISATQIFDTGPVTEMIDDLNQPRGNVRMRWVSVPSPSAWWLIPCGLLVATRRLRRTA